MKNLKEILAKPPESGGKKSNRILIFCIIAAIIYLAVSSFFADKPKTVNVESSMESEVSLDTYISTLEQRLVTTLQKIEGAGKVFVFISMESSGKKILATDKKTETSYNDTKEIQTEQREQSEESIVMSEGDTGHSPYIIEEKMPAPAGVLVIAEGARVEHVRLEIYEAVKALFGLAAHRIKVTY